VTPRPGSVRGVSSWNSGKGARGDERKRQNRSMSAMVILRQLSERCLLAHFRFAADACSITRQDNGVPFFRAIAARSALVSSRSLHKACASSCRIARSSKSSMGMCHIALSSTPRIDALTTNAPSRNVSRVGRYVKAGLFESNLLSDRICFQSSVRTSTHVHSPSASTGYRARAFLKTVEATWHSGNVYPKLQAKCCFGALAFVSAASGRGPNTNGMTVSKLVRRTKTDR